MPELPMHYKYVFATLLGCVEKVWERNSAVLNLGALKRINQFHLGVGKRTVFLESTCYVMILTNIQVGIQFALF